jgi:hypothetical protein
MVLDEINLSRPEQFFADFLSAAGAADGQRRLTLVNDPVSERAAAHGRRAAPADPAERVVHRHREPRREHRRVRGQDLRPRTRDGDAAQDRGGALHGRAKGERSPISYEAAWRRLRGGGRQEAAVQKATRGCEGPLRGRPPEALPRRLGQPPGAPARPLPARRRRVGRLIGEAMDHLLVTKVLRKLKDRHDVRATALEELRDKLQTAWEKPRRTNPPERCVALIDTRSPRRRARSWS